MVLLKSSAILSLGSQITGAAGLSDVSSYMGKGAQYMAYAFVGLHVATGIANWMHDPRFQNVRVSGNGPASTYQSGDVGYVNGIDTSLETAMKDAKQVGASMLSYNPTSSPIADLTESLFSKVFFTGSVERQLSTSLTGLTDITLKGFSQGGIIASNVALSLGLTDQRHVLSQLTVGSTQISQVRFAISGAIGGLDSRHLLYKTGMWDFSAFLAPHLNPINFSGGIAGAAILPVGIQNHYWPY
jgi:hypothetical protein